jgi:MoxR-like ATPase
VFRFVRGPIFANIVLADEINRTPPKTQSALLQSMQEYQVTAAGNTYELDKPFFVMATQNPIEQEGTYPLPEAQLDRFMLSINIGYPTKQEECQIVNSTTQDVSATVRQVLRARDILWIQKLVRQIPATEHVVEYAVDLARATRPNEPDSPDFVKKMLAWGAGPRAAQYLVLGAKARALLKGRVAVHAADVRAMAKPVLRHRVFTNFNADAEGVDTDQIIERLVAAVPEPSYGEKGAPPSLVVVQDVPKGSSMQPPPDSQPTIPNPAAAIAAQSGAWPPGAGPPSP